MVKNAKFLSRSCELCLLLLSLVFAAVIFFGCKTVLAQEDCESIPSDSANINHKIDCLNNKLGQLSQAASTLKNQIAQFNAQISLTTLKITETQDKIDLLGGRINTLETSLTDLTNAFSARAVATYMMARGNEPVFLLLSASNVPDALSKFRYLEKVQGADYDLLVRLQTAQDSYKVSKQTTEDLQKQLQVQKNALSSQKAAKAQLLSATKSDETRYQQLLSQAFAERAAVEKALVSGVQVGPVKKGDPIALMGNSGYPGCSTAKHLHFEIRKNGSWTDPLAYLTNKSVINDQDGTGNVSVGSGSWDWPISDAIRVTQFYGHTPYSYVYKYSGGIHTGIDMVSTGGDVIRAPADGILFKSSQACSGSTINIVYIDHGSGVVSLYLHVQ